ncbi:zinc-binding alcohol dehydrogenase family protein [Microbulbifer hydrolyticus]|uniref:Zinc-type alcohol dehydrogenase-like protein n=1 Tax=Microbulbifer hydrolyticus TaxID=48074 RepID=A0A6P1TDV7_9GAMM|nr:zinc-binding alcohol dehydrogenase family protein [Microbulbifer hydrolyticus]MBB5212370.1 zinc-binding alcohol dehydrogenase family protein [Microbulbifer hydrolyticus]QHQ40011.1 zinc-binding alcohol dehydrogenase family protein [Microbulbifer hydrolyticus]
MKAIGLHQYLPIDKEESLADLNIDRPTPGPRDLLVSIKAIAVNPVDTKVRAPKATPVTETTPKILGWDAAGEVVAVGSEVKNFAEGDRVFYAGDITRPGCNSEFQLVDERIVGKMPRTQDFQASAALPLTSITAWEALFDRLGISPEGKDSGKTILIVGGAGGVGSIAIQLASTLAKLNVIATASRTKSSMWVKEMGARHVVNHRNPLDQELKDIGFENVDYILCLNNTDQHFPAMASAIKPQGKICTIVENTAPLEIGLLKAKSATFVWEFMFTRAMFQTEDMEQQGVLLNRIAELIDRETLVTTVGETIEPINATNLRLAHRQLETGSTIGKIVLAGWE